MEVLISIGTIVLLALAVSALFQVVRMAVDTKQRLERIEARLISGDGRHAPE